MGSYVSSPKDSALLRVYLVRRTGTRHVSGTVTHVAFVGHRFANGHQGPRAITMPTSTNGSFVSRMLDS